MGYFGSFDLWIYFEERLWAWGPIFPDQWDSVKSGHAHSSFDKSKLDGDISPFFGQLSEIDIG